MYAQHLPDGTWRELVGNVVFSPNVYQTAESLTDEQRTEFNVYAVIDAPRESITHAQKYGDPVYQLDGATVTRSYPAVDKTSEELAADTAAQASAVRAERNARLSASDWTQVLDAPVNREAWAAYRQALRDLTAQDGFPWSVNWPDQP